MITGACLCGAVQLRINGELRAPRYCHCENCRKFAGTTPAAWAMANAEALQHDSAADGVSKFNSGHGLRCFCANCGSPVWFESLDYPEIVAIPLGVLDAGDVPAPTMHLWTNSKPSWCTLDDNLDKHPQGPPKAIW